MKSLTNFLWIIGACSLVFAYPQQFLKNADITKIVADSAKSTDSVIHQKSSVDSRLDSIDTEIKYMHEKGLSQITTNYQILQSKKEELLQLAVCVDSIFHSYDMEADSISVCDTVN